jgi:SpoVK/Ycf46/Vps4 family AAA+-type ATPase
MSGGTDDSVRLLAEGLSAIAELFHASAEEELRAAWQGWCAYEGRLRALAPDHATIAALAARFGLGSLELRIVLYALGGQIGPGPSEAGRLELPSGPVPARLVVDRLCDRDADRARARAALAPDSDLVRRGLLRVVEGGHGLDGLQVRAIAVGEPVTRFLLGEAGLGQVARAVAQLTVPEVPLLEVVIDPGQLRQVVELAAQRTAYREVLREWGVPRLAPHGRGVGFLFSGPSGTGKSLTAAAIATHLRRPLLTVSTPALPAGPPFEATLAEVLTEATVQDAVLVFDRSEALFGEDDPRTTLAYSLLEGFEGVTILATQRPGRLDAGVERRMIYHLPFQHPDTQARRQIWEVHLPPELPLADDVDLDVLASQYDFPGATIKNAIRVAVTRAITEKAGASRIGMAHFEHGCRSQLPEALEDLAVRTESQLALRDVVLPEDAERKLREILAAVRNQATVLQSWGFGKRLTTGKGVAILFDGPPGTGKTLCAEVIAGELGRPLYRVNLPEVVSKYVGETEKHIRLIFQRARASHAMLLFDEADALFSARVAETRSATDRYANMEVNLLLQEIERFPGVSILTTNFYGTLDKALIRRVQYRVTFQEPDEEQRRRIWETLCPPEAPLEAEVSFAALARDFDLTGGMIKNALLRAAYLACEEGSAITQAVLRQSCEEECRAVGKVTRRVPPAATRP